MVLVTTPKQTRGVSWQWTVCTCLQAVFSVELEVKTTLLVLVQRLRQRQEGWYGTAPASLMHRLVESIAKTSESNVDIVQTAVVRTLRAIMTSRNAVSMSTIAGATFDISRLFGNQNSSLQLAKEALLDTLRSVFFRMEAYDVMARGQARKIADAVSDTKSKSVDVGCRWRTQRQPRPQKWKVQPFLSVSYGQLRIVDHCARCVPRELPVDAGSGRIHGSSLIVQHAGLPTLSL
jgi:hypothetical protein